MTRRRPLRINILTIFPEMVQAAFSQSILKRAVDKQLFAPAVVNIRDYARDRHHTVDDKPYGGGSGMVMKVEPIHRALADLKKRRRLGNVYLMAPTGKPFNQAMAQRLSRTRSFTLICGRYEGVDERVSRHLCDGEISVGDFVLSGGEPAAVVVTDAVVRLIPGVLGDQQSALFDSFSDGLLDYPHYTRPDKYRSWRVPPELLSGDHRGVAQWRRHRQLERTLAARPDLLTRAPLAEADREALEALRKKRRTAVRR